MFMQQIRQHRFYQKFQVELSIARASCVCTPSLLFLWLAILSTGALAQTTTSQSPQPELKSAGAEMRASGGGYLGVYLGDVNEERAKELKLSEVRGAVVGKVEEASPAAKAGLRENDVILSLNERAIYNPAQLYGFLTDATPGSRVTLSVTRNGAVQAISVVLGQRRSAMLDERRRLFADSDAMVQTADDRAQQAEDAKRRGDEKEAARLLDEEKSFRKQADERRQYVEKQLQEGNLTVPTATRRPGYNVSSGRHQLGLRLLPLTEQLARYFNVKNGLLIAEVRAGEPAERAGIKAGDCLVAVNGVPVTSLGDLNSLVERGVEKDAELSVTVMRDRTEQTLKVKLDKRL